MKKLKSSTTSPPFNITEKNTKAGVKKPGLTSAKPMKKPPEKEFFRKRRT